MRIGDGITGKISYRMPNIGCKTHSARRIVSLLIPQRVDRIQERSLVRGIETEEDADESGKTEGEQDREW